MATASVMSSTDDDDKQRCRTCQSPALLLDWAAGDLVCTNCGVVQEEHVCDTRPEWREFHDDADLAKGLPSMARCGTAPVDESKYLGGLEPTRLSKQVFGGGACSIRKTLLKINRQADHMMIKHNAKALKQAKLSRKVRQKLMDSGDNTETDCTDMEPDNVVRPEHDLQIIQEEEDAIRSQAALSAEKWSLPRAILLFGTQQEQPQNQTNREEERLELEQSLDKTMLRASSDLYKAYSLLQQSCRTLHLPDRVSHEATNMLCKYAARRNGFFVKGVSSRVSQKGQELDKETLSRLREFNKVKQMASLGSALLFLTARNLGWARSLQEVCSSFSQVPNEGTAPKPEIAIKPKHCYRAVHQIKAAFPDYARSVLVTCQSNGESGLDDTDHFVEHATRKLNLPPVALASVKILVATSKKQQGKSSTAANNTSTLSTICASVTYFVCVAGDTMQRLAQQAQAKQQEQVGSSKRRGLKRKSAALMSSAAAMPGKKLFKTEISLVETKNSIEKSVQQEISDDTKESSEPTSKDADNASTKETCKPFDVFSHEPIQQDPSAKAEYEARRVWDAWTEQTPWSRSVGVIEQSCGVSRNAVMDYYKKTIFPKRTELLQKLTDCASNESIRDTPLASSLLSNISAAAPLLSNKWKD